MNTRYSKFVSFATAVLAAALSGCGGGGGAGVTSPEFRAQWGLGATNVSQAHATIAAVRGASVKPGAGVTVAVMDSGVDLDHPELVGADIAETLFQNLSDEDGTVVSHGTAVASVIAAQPNGSGFLGIAYGADVNVYTVPLGQNSGQTFDWEQAYKDVLADGVDIVNASYGISGTFVENYTEADIRALPWIGEFTVIAQQSVSAADRTIFVWAAGNDHGKACNPSETGVQNCDVDSDSPMGGYYDATSPNLDGGAVARLAELRGHNIVVVAITEDGGIADFSNRCGFAREWCIAAPGADVAVAYFGPRSETDPTAVREDRIFNGTSFAAPMVSGGLALMKHYFNDTLSNSELVTRLFETANSTGSYGTAATYGHGLMDLGAAVRPVGQTMLTMGRHIGDAGYSIRATSLRLGGALGDGLSRSLAGRKIAAFDRLGAPFWFDLSGLVGTAARSSATARLRDLLARAEEEARPAAGGTRLSVQQHATLLGRDGWRFGLYGSPVQAESSLLNLAQNAATMTFRTKNSFEATAFTNTGLAAHQDTPESGAMVSWRPSDSPYGIRLGWLGEQKTMLGSTADGAFGGLSAGSVVAGFEVGTEFEGWRLAADAELGLVVADTDGGIIAGLSEVTTSAISFRADRRLTNGDEITLSLSQPPRIEHGVARLTVPISRTKDGMVLHETISADLSPSGRQIDLAARWRRNHVLGGDLLAEAVFSHNPGHVDGKPEFGLLAGWRVAF